MDNGELVERRKHRRFQVQDIAFAVLKNKSRQIGQITDISMGGLAFNYIASQENNNGSSELDILLAFKGLYVEKIHFKTVSDFQIANKSPFSPITMRRRGIKFGKITGNQTSMLEDFIRDHTKDNQNAKPLKHPGEGVASISMSL